MPHVRVTGYKQFPQPGTTAPDKEQLIVHNYNELPLLAMIARSPYQSSTCPGH